MATASSTETEEPLISNRLLLKITAVIGILAALAAGIGIAGKYMGDELALGGHTVSEEVQNVIVGQDVLSLPANVIRFESQRHTGPAEIVNIYLSWPAMRGYTRDTAALFSNPADSDGLIFADFSQSVMSRDMSGRLEPIYQKLFAGSARIGPAGLQIHDMAVKSGFGDEKLLIGSKKNGEIYVVRCLLPSDRRLATSADCQRDIHVGRDLTLLYRFSSNLLPQWEKIDASLLDFAARHLQP